MEILLIACLLAYTAGAQSEQSKLGLSPAQRDIMREATRHEKAVQKIADKHNEATVPSAAGASPWKNPSTNGRSAAPDTFLSGYRTQRPARTPLGHRAGTWAGSGISWAQSAGRDAWQSYRKQRKDAGRDDPALVVAPIPPEQPPAAPPMPTYPPMVAADADKSTAAPKPEPENKQVVDLKKAPEPTPKQPIPDAMPAAADPDTTPADTPQGVGRMAAEVTYESVLDESDELSIMCEDDVRVYDRIRDRAEREIGRGDSLIAVMQGTGFGSRVIGWLARCKENYSVIHAKVDDLQKNTIAQGEKVVQAKALLEAGQGVYADIAKDMEDVAERDAYISDAVDAEDTSAHTEVYETKAA